MIIIFGYLRVNKYEVTETRGNMTWKVTIPLMIFISLPSSVSGEWMPPTTRPPTPPPTTPPYDPFAFSFSYENRSIPLNMLRTVLPAWNNFIWTPEYDCSFILDDGSCRGKCTKSTDRHRVTSNSRTCFCDPVCLEVGDCCHDYIQRCRKDSQWKKPSRDRSSPKSCIKVDDGHGYIMVSGCSDPSSDDETAKKCRGDDNQMTSLLSSTPVFDHAQLITYKNMYCAKCNNATKFSYWTLNVDCRQSDFSAYWNNPDVLLQIVKKNCTWKYEPSAAMKRNYSKCYLPDEKCRIWEGRNEQETYYRKVVHDLCSMYSLPVFGRSMLARNPHCAMCRNITGAFGCFNVQPYNPPAPLTILFDFTSTNKYNMNIKQGKDTRKTYSKEYNCGPGQAYDILTMKCTDLPTEPSPSDATTVVSTGSAINETGSAQNGNGSAQNGSYSQGSKLNGTDPTQSIKEPKLHNCSLVIYRACDYEVLKNKSILIISEGNTYPKGSYMIRGSKAVVCLKKNNDDSHQEPLIDSNHGNQITEQQIVTYIGHALSFVAEITLLLIYSTFKVLRNIPGKNLMCFTASLLVYQVLFLLTGFNDIRDLCTAVAILLHYFVLTSFSWMAVMAFDVMRTFTSKGVRSSQSRYRFIKHCCFAWGVPLAFVATCVTLDKTVPSINIGYGSGKCWMAKTPYLIAAVHTPVAMVILFNFVALIVTITAIRRTQKSSKMARGNSKNTLPMLIVKLSSVMGFTWILGLLVGLVDSYLILYSYIVLNSLQGFFVGVLFITNKNTAKLVSDKRRATKSTSGINLMTMTSTKTSPQAPRHDGIDNEGLAQD